MEAGDLDSLLAQFEASEAVNKTDSGSPEHENKSKSIGQSKLMGSVSSVASGRRPSVPGTVLSSNLPQISPTHQNIKDALPKEIIEKIKGQLQIWFSISLLLYTLTKLKIFANPPDPIL